MRGWETQSKILSQYKKSTAYKKAKSYWHLEEASWIRGCLILVGFQFQYMTESSSVYPRKNQ